VRSESKRFGTPSIGGDKVQSW